MANGDADLVPWWLSWVVPIVTGVTLVAIVLRRLLTQALREDFAAMVNEKHEENMARFDAFDKKLTAVESELVRIGKDISYLRGLRRLPGERA